MAEVIRGDFPDPELARDARVATAASMLGDLADFQPEGVSEISDFAERTRAYVSGLSPEEQHRALEIALRLNDEPGEQHLEGYEHDAAREALLARLHTDQAGHELPRPSPAEAEQIAARFIEQERIRKGII